MCLQCANNNKIITLLINSSCILNFSCCKKFSFLVWLNDGDGVNIHPTSKKNHTQNIRVNVSQLESISRYSDLLHFIPASFVSKSTSTEKVLNIHGQRIRYDKNVIFLDWLKHESYSSLNTTKLDTSCY